MAWLRPIALACIAAIVGCSDDGDSQGADDSTGPAAEGSESAGTPDPTITTTASTSLTNGTNDDGGDTGMASASATVGDSTGAADGSDGGDDHDADADADASGGTTAGGSTGTTDPTGMSGSDGSEDGTTGMGATPVGSECTEDAECTTGVCWDWSDYDPFCFGAICSGECASDEDCVELATDAAAPYPDAVYCGDDGLCVFLESGLGAWACQ